MMSGPGSLFAAAFVIGTFPVLTRLVSPTFDAAAQTFMRFVLATGLLALLNVKRRNSFRLDHRDLARMALLGALSVALGVCLAVAATGIKVSVAMAVLFGASIVTATLGGLSMGEPVGLARAVGTVVALAGLALYSDELAGSAVGVAAALVGGVCDGTCNVLRRRVRHIDRDVAVTYQYGIGAVLALVVMLAMGNPLITTVKAAPVIAMVAYAIASVALGTLLFRGFAGVDVSIGAVIMASQVFFTVMLGMLLLGEVPSLQEAAGVLLVFAASVVSVQGDRLRAASGRPGPERPYVPAGRRDVHRRHNREAGGFPARDSLNRPANATRSSPTASVSAAARRTVTQTPEQGQ